MMLKSVVLPEPFGPMRPTSPRSGTANVTLRSTVKPPNRCPTARSSRMAGSAARARSRLRGSPAPEALDHAHQAAGQSHDHADEGQAEEDLMKVAEATEQL